MKSAGFYEYFDVFNWFCQLCVVLCEGSSYKEMHHNLHCDSIHYMDYSFKSFFYSKKMKIYAHSI